MMNNKTLSVIALLCCSTSVSAAKITGLAEVSLVSTEKQASWLNSWMQGGVGLLRYDEQDSIVFNQAFIELEQNLPYNISFNGTAHYQADGEQNLGISEAYLSYLPLSQGFKHQFKAGFFYPRMSLENADSGWTSPYNYNFSAINSWLAEELRTIGMEWTVSRPGRVHRSPHSYSFTLSAFQANDGLASLLAWRGWALHNRQTVYGEQVNFANYFQFQSNPTPNPTYVVPFKETDNRLGFYLGANWRYLRSTDVRVYFYDNLADPMAVEPDMQYAWRNQFVSIAGLHKFNKQWRVLAQWMDGYTEMGDKINGVFFDYNAWYLLLSYHHSDHRYSVRYDKFSVTDTDINPEDPNDSDGSAVTLTWRYDINSAWQAGVEYIHVDSSNDSRTLWRNWQAQQKQTQFMATIQYRF